MSVMVMVLESPETPKAPSLRVNRRSVLIVVLLLLLLPPPPPK
jgi:hypothetical protein